MAYSLDSRGHSEVGLVRKSNQDSAYRSGNALVVADGMGGAAAGDIASAIAIREVEQADSRYDGMEMLSKLAGALARANHLVADLVSSDPALDGMGTTVCGALFSGTQLGLVHIGDSRAYLLRGGTMQRLTHDHSWVQSLIDEGRITEEEAARHPHRSLVLKVINGQNHEPDMDLFDVQLDDRVLFCSDGLSGFADESEIAEILLEEHDLDEVTKKLVAAAYEGGGADNISFLVADVVPQDEALDAVSPQLYGSVLDAEIPEPADEEIAEYADDDTVVTSAVKAPSKRTTAGEGLRYSPTARRGRRWIPTLALLIALGVVLAGVFFGGRQYIAGQYYVGNDSGKVAIFNGIPDRILGRSFSDVVERTDINLTDLPTFYRNQVTNTIPVSDVTAARATIAELGLRSEACIRYREEQLPPSPSASASNSTRPTSSGSADATSGPSASPSPSASPVGSASASPLSTPSGTYTVGPGEGC